MFFFVKILVSAFLIALSSEVAKRFPLVGALIISLPMGSILALSWLHVEGEGLPQIGQMAHDIFILVIPSLVFFLALPFFIKKGWTYWPSLAGSCFVTSLVYGVFMAVRQRFFG